MAPLSFPLLQSFAKKGNDLHLRIAFVLET